MAERVAVVIAERSFGCGSNVGEDQRGRCLRGDPLEINTIPSWGSRGEYTWLGAKLGIGVVPYSKPIA